MQLRNTFFWPTVAGVGIVLLAQRPSLYSNTEMFLGLWLGTLLIALGGASLVALIYYLVFPIALRSKTWLVFVIVSWLLAFFQLIGEWALPDYIRYISKKKGDVSLSSKDNLSPPSPATPAMRPTQKSIDVIDQDEYPKRRARADLECKKGNLVDLDCHDAVLNGRK